MMHRVIVAIAWAGVIGIAIAMCCLISSAESVSEWRYVTGQFMIWYVALVAVGYAIFGGGKEEEEL